MRIVLLFVFSITYTYAQPGGQITLGFADRYDSLPTLRFEATTAANYERLAPTTSFIPSQPVTKGPNILVPTAQGDITFKRYEDQLSLGDGFLGWEYKGYLTIPKMHVLVSHHVAEHLGFSDMVLMDSISTMRYVIASVGDAAVEVPITSGDGRLIVYYYNYVYDRNSCFIGILGASNPINASNLALSEIMSFQTKDWAVEAIRWVDNSSFIIKAYTVQRTSANEKKQYAYYLATVNTSAK